MPGQFGQATGGSDALLQAMQRRGIDASALDTMSPAAGGTPVAPPVPQSNPRVGAMPAPQAQQPDNFRSDEMKIALKAMQNTISTENKIAEQAMGLR